MNKLRIVTFCFVLIALISCSENLFGSSDGGNCSSDISCLRLDAENAFRSGNYRKAYETYSRIVSIDSTASVGYFGMAKASLWMKGVNPFDMFRFADANKLEDDDGNKKIPFKDDSIKVQNRYYQGTKLAYIPLAELNRRDSLTILYELHQKELSGQAVYISDSLMRDLQKFRDEFSPFDRFPLSDREYKSNAFYGGYSVFAIAKTMLEFFDTNDDNCITKDPIIGGILGVDNPGEKSNEAKWLEWDCTKVGGKFGYDLPLGLNPDGTINTEQILEILKGDLEGPDGFYERQLIDSTDIPQDIENINNKIDNFNGNLDEVIDILGGEGDWQGEMSKYSDYASFFKIGTRLDEDGDGCIDEELLNGSDNDGDNIKGEDARLANTDPSKSFWGNIGKNHVMMFNENPNDEENLPIILDTLPEGATTTPYFIYKNKERTAKTELWGDSVGVVTVIKFTQRPEYWTTDSLELKLEVAQDTQCGNLKYGLQKRKELVGGCWLFYSDEQFRRIWLNRHANDCCKTNPNCDREKNN